MYSYGPPHMAVQKQDDQHEHTFSSYVRIQDVVLKTCLGRWTIGRSGERGSGISVLPAWHDDDDDITLSYNSVQCIYEDWDVPINVHRYGIYNSFAFSFNRIYLIKELIYSGSLSSKPSFCFDANQISSSTMLGWLRSAVLVEVGLEHWLCLLCNVYLITGLWTSEYHCY